MIARGPLSGVLDALPKLSFPREVASVRDSSRFNAANWQLPTGPRPPGPQSGFNQKGRLQGAGNRSNTDLTTVGTVVKATRKYELDRSNLEKVACGCSEN